MNCGVDHRCGSDLVLLWLWCMLAAAALIRPLAWELPYALSAALKRQKDPKKRKDSATVSRKTVVTRHTERKNLSLGKELSILRR